MVVVVDSLALVAVVGAVEGPCWSAWQGGIDDSQEGELAVVDTVDVSFVEEHLVDRTGAQQEEGDMSHLMDCIHVALVGIVMAQCARFPHLGTKSWH
jgi:hypothetical protein